MGWRLPGGAPGICSGGHLCSDHCPSAPALPPSPPGKAGSPGCPRSRVGGSTHTSPQGVADGGVAPCPQGLGTNLPGMKRAGGGKRGGGRRREQREEVVGRWGQGRSRDSGCGAGTENGVGAATHWDIPGIPTPGRTPAPRGAPLVPLRTREGLQDQELPPSTPCCPFTAWTRPRDPRGVPRAPPAAPQAVPLCLIR